MIPFYQKIVAFVVAGVAATLIIYRYWFLTEKKKAIDGGELKEIKEGLEEKKRKEEEEKSKEEREERRDQLKTEVSEKSEKTRKIVMEATKEEEDVKTGKSIRDEPKKLEKSSEDKEEADAKTCKSIKAAASPPQIVAEKTGSCTAAVASVRQQKSAQTLLNEMKENSVRVKAEATSETNVFPKTSETPEKKTEETNPMFGRFESPPPLSITRDAPKSPGVPLTTTSDDLYTKDAQRIPESVPTTLATTDASSTPTTPSTSTTDVAKEPQAMSKAPVAQSPKKPESGTSSSCSQPTLSAVNSEIELTEGGTIRTKVMGLHQCFCRAVGRSKAIEDDQGVYDPKVKLNIQPTEIHPISYSIYEPIPLTKPIKQKTSLAKEILTKPKREKTDYLTPFGPILNAVAYTHQHSLMIEDLVNNKDFFDF